MKRGSLGDVVPIAFLLSPLVVREAGAAGSCSSSSCFGAGQSSLIVGELLLGFRVRCLPFLCMAGSCRIISASIAQLLLRGQGAAVLRRATPELQSCVWPAGRLWAPAQASRRLQRSFCTRSYQSPYGSHETEDYFDLPEYEPGPVNTGPSKMFIVRARGLPWSCTAEDVLSFFSGCNVRNGIDGVHFIFNRDGKPRGDAVIEFETADDLVKALEQHKKYLGQRYVEVFEMSQKDAESLLQRLQAPMSPTTSSSVSQAAQSVAGAPSDGTVRLRGLPYSCSEQDIVNFFSGLSIADEGITFVFDHRGRKSGEAFVQFISEEHAEQALLRHKKEIGSRYIEIFPSRKNEIQNARFLVRKRKGVTFAPTMKELYDPDLSINNENKERQSDLASENNHMNDYGKDMSGKVVDANEFTVVSPAHDIHIRGLPFHASGQDIANFFHPVMPLKINIEYSADAGGTSGEAVVRFLTHEDAVSAMAKNRCHMQQGYLELFLNSSPDGK
ncbi:G-rich sequence factor 1 isoform X2 [Bufo gargarizans]|uniref:G-rich sequence factor 1 isoform X2 n=1 Tax=Bufo gargarizans TaxID=30331 RepID=UPI001CF0F6BF|nr:G-rich sequence factor 1 isoform X2 [Bufo gargarizans]